MTLDWQEIYVTFNPIGRINSCWSPDPLPHLVLVYHHFLSSKIHSLPLSHSATITCHYAVSNFILYIYQSYLPVDPHRKPEVLYTLNTLSNINICKLHFLNYGLLGCPRCIDGVVVVVVVVMVCDRGECGSDGGGDGERWWWWW